MLKVLWQFASTTKGGQRQTKVSVNKQEIVAHLENVLRQTGQVGKVKIELTLVGDEAIQKLKQQFLGINEPTDVLSFNDQPDKTGLLGSIVISVDAASQQAAQAGISITDEIKMLASHGLLHLLGFNHR